MNSASDKYYASGDISPINNNNAISRVSNPPEPVAPPNKLDTLGTDKYYRSGGASGVVQTHAPLAAVLPPRVRAKAAAGVETKFTILTRAEVREVFDAIEISLQSVPSVEVHVADSKISMDVYTQIDLAMARGRLKPTDRGRVRVIPLAAKAIVEEREVTESEQKPIVVPYLQPVLAAPVSEIKPHPAPVRELPPIVANPVHSTQPISPADLADDTDN